MKARLWITATAVREAAPSYQTHHMPDVCIIIRNINSRRMKTRMQEASGMNRG